MHRLGFYSKWIRGYMESSSILVLVNGSPTANFKPMRGLRHGDPLALFLFIVVAEGLVGLVRQTLKANMLKSVKVGRYEVESCMLQFADDTLFMCEATFYNVITMKVILRCYELAFGLNIDFHKSKLTGINVEKNTLVCYAIFKLNTNESTF